MSRTTTWTWTEKSFFLNDSTFKPGTWNTMTYDVLNFVGAGQINPTAVLTVGCQIYYNVDNDPTTADDHYHPNPTGYIAMSNYWADHIIDYLSPTFIDEFARTPAGMLLNGSNNWLAAATIQIRNVGESGGGAVYHVGSVGEWQNMAIWQTTVGPN